MIICIALFCLSPMPENLNMCFLTFWAGMLSNYKWQNILWLVFQHVCQIHYRCISRIPRFFLLCHKDNFHRKSGLQRIIQKYKNSFQFIKCYAKFLETILVAFEAVRLGHSISTYFELSLQIITVDLLDNITPFDL